MHGKKLVIGLVAGLVLGSTVSAVATIDPCTQTFDTNVAGKYNYLGYHAGDTVGSYPTWTSLATAEKDRWKFGAVNSMHYALCM